MVTFLGASQKWYFFVFFSKYWWFQTKWFSRVLEFMKLYKQNPLEKILIFNYNLPKLYIGLKLQIMQMSYKLKVWIQEIGILSYRLGTVTNQVKFDCLCIVWHKGGTGGTGPRLQIQFIHCRSTLSDPSNWQYYCVSLLSKQLLWVYERQTRLDLWPAEHLVQAYCS